jgi:hypothetical protein
MNLALKKPPVDAEDLTASQPALVAVPAIAAL